MDLMASGSLQLMDSQWQVARHLLPAEKHDGDSFDSGDQRVLSPIRKGE
jgi:hypothetical protein